MKSLEAESGVIGSILIDGVCLPEVAAILTSDDFHREANRKIYDAALALSCDGQPVDPLTIAGVVGESYARYMLELMEITPTSANAGLYAQEVRKASMWRSLKALGEGLVSASVIDDPRQAIGEAVKEMERIESMDRARELVTSGEALSAFYDYRAQVDAGTGGCVKTGFRQLDGLLGGGLLDSGFYVLAARPGVGKTTFALSIADKVAQTCGGVLFVSLEMDVEQIMAKRIARETGISASELVMGKHLSLEQGAEMASAANSLAKLPFAINRKPRATVDDIRSMARKVKDLRMIVVDYFGLIRTPGKSASRYEAMTDISGQLKALARSLKLPVLCLAQLNRENMKRKNAKPLLSDLRDTGALEQDADGVIFLHRPDYYDDETRSDPGAPVLLQVILAKNRHGSTGEVEMAFSPHTGRIVPARYT